MNKRKLIVVMIPCYNEEGNVRAMAEKIIEIMEGFPYRFEILFTDNCSTDHTREIIRDLCQKDKRIKAIFNSRNYGVIDGRSYQNTMNHLNSEMDALIYIPCDFQEPPERIPEFIKAWEDGYLAVCGQKTASKESKIKYLCRCLFYKIIDKFSDMPQYHNISGIFLIDRIVKEKLMEYDSDFQFRWAIADMGYEVKMIPYEQQERKSGKSSFDMWKYLTFAITSLVSTSVAPLRIATVLGTVMAFLSFLAGMIYLILKLVFWYQFEAGIAPILIGMLFLGSIQLMFMGIVGEYVGAILQKVRKTPDVVVSEYINMEQDL